MFYISAHLPKVRIGKTSKPKANSRMAPKSQTPPIPFATPAAQRLTAIRVLLIEDNPADARLVREMFLELGTERFELEHADRMTAGLTCLERQGFDALLLDLSLPDSQGLAGIERVLTQVPTLPIVVLTGLDDERLSLTALEHGAQDYLVKGQVGADLLARTLRHAIERKNVELVLRESEQRYRDLFAESLGLICVHDVVGLLFAVNPAGAAQLGYAPEELIGRNMRELVAPRFQHQFDDYLDRLRQQGTDSGLLSVLDRAGRNHILAYKNVLHRDPHSESYVIGYAQDVTAEQQAKAALKKSEDLFRTLAGHAPVGIFLTDAEGNWIYANERCYAMTGLTPEEARGIGWLRAVHPDDKQAVLGAWQATMQSGGEFAMEFRSLSAAGQTRWLTGSSAAQRNSAGAVSGYVGTLADISERKQMEEKLRELSLTDELTGLHNRRGFLSAAQQSVALARRNLEGVLLLFIDLDNMKHINDRYGHDEGDRALRTTADLLRRVFRESDVLARLGGDEFAVLHLEPGGHDAELVRARLDSSLAEVNAQGVLPYALAMSIGMVHRQPDAIGSLDDLLAAADAQMYEIKRNKRKRS